MYTECGEVRVEAFIYSESIRLHELFPILDSELPWSAEVVHVTRDGTMRGNGRQQARPRRRTPEIMIKTLAVAVRILFVRSTIINLFKLWSMFVMMNPNQGEYIVKSAS